MSERDVVIDELAEFHRIRQAESQRGKRKGKGSRSKRRGRPPKAQKLQPFSVRICPTLRCRLERAALLMNARSVGAWARDILGVAADTVLSTYQQPPTTPEPDPHPVVRPTR